MQIGCTFLIILLNHWNHLNIVTVQELRIHVRFTHMIVKTDTLWMKEEILQFTSFLLIARLTPQEFFGVIGWMTVISIILGILSKQPYLVLRWDNDDKLENGLLQ